MLEARLNGLNIRYTDNVNPGKDAVVFLHGFPFSHTMWNGQIEVLKDSYRLISYDHRGHGESDVGDGQYTLEYFVDDFFALLDHLKIEKVIAIGLSMGGYAMLRALEREPSRFKAVVLCDTRSDSDSSETRLKRAAAVKLVKTKGVSEFAEGFLKSVFAPENLAKLPAVDVIRQTILKTSPLAICGTLLALASRSDTSNVLPTLRIPALVMVGEHDVPAPPGVAQTMASAIPGSSFFLIPHAGHLSNLENPSEFNTHLVEFLAQI